MSLYNHMRSIRRAYGITEAAGSEDPGAAMDAIGDLADIVERYNSGELDGGQLGRELVGWFKSSLSSITAALGMEGGDANEEAWQESVMDEEDDSDRFARFEEMLASEGGPGSGPRPGGMPDAGDDIGMDGDVDMIDDPMADDAGGPDDLGPDTIEALRDIIGRLEDLVGDVDPEGDLPDDDGDDEEPDDDEDDGPPPRKPAKKEPPSKKKEK